MAEASPNELNCIVGIRGAAEPPPGFAQLLHRQGHRAGEEWFAVYRRGGGGAATLFALPERDADVVVLGSVAAAGLRGERLAEAIAEAVESFDAPLLRRLTGLFTVIVHDHRRNLTHFVSDTLGIHPFFITERPDGIAFGTDVMALRKAGLSGGRVDYDAVASWMVYGFNATRGSLFEGVGRLPPSTVVTWGAAGAAARFYGPELRNATAYAPDEAADAIHAMVSANLTLLTEGMDRANILLSGGYDSRYLAGLLARRPRSTLRLTNIAVTEGEGSLARETAERLGLKLETIRVPGSIWDVFDEPFSIRPDGFPIPKNLLVLAAERAPGLPIVNGFMGDSLVRGSHDKLFGNYEWESVENPADLLDRGYAHWRYDFFEPRLLGRVRERARAAIAREVAAAPLTGKAFTWVDLLCRQRLYISNNFLGHMHIAQPVLPFYAPDLVRYKLEQPCWNFTRRTYQRIFANHLPKLADLPHATDLPSDRPRNRMAAGVHRRWAAGLINRLTMGGDLPFVRRRAVIPRLVAAMADPRMDYLVVSLRHWLLLEEMARKNGIDVAWERI